MTRARRRSGRSRWLNYASIVLGTSNKRSIITYTRYVKWRVALCTMKSGGRERKRKRKYRRITTFGSAKFFSLGFTRSRGTVKAVSRRRYKKSLLFPLDGSHSWLCTCLRTTAEFVRWNAYNNARPPTILSFSSSSSFPCPPFFFNDRGWKLKLLAPQRSTRLLTKKKKKINVNVARRRRRRFIIRWMRRWDETEERILVEAWMKDRKKERKEESKLRFENMNVCIFVTRREYLIKRKKKNHSYRAIYLIN